MSMCEQYAEKISAFMDGELSEKERLEVMEHLAVCPACKDYFEDQLAIREAIREAEDTAPAGFTQRVMDAVSATPQQKKKTAHRWQSWAAAAACCALALLGVYGGSMKKPDAPAAMNYALEQKQSEAVTAESTAETFSTYSGEAEVVCDTTGAAAAENEAMMARTACAAIATADAAARQWAEDTLGLEWVSGESCELTAQEYSQLLQLLEDAGAEFTVEESSQGFLLKME